jgi:hypothetical protein
MHSEALLQAATELLGKEAELLFALVNFYGLIIVAVIGWIVNTGKDGPGISWFRVVLFNTGFLAFLAASFAGFWYLYERIAATAALWARLAGSDAGAIVWLPPRDWLWAVWIFNGLILFLATVLLRRGGYGRDTSNRGSGPKAA